MATTQYSTVNGREFGFYVPDSYDASKPTPLLFMFHGFGGDSSTSSGGSAERNYYGWQDTAEENGFITIFPEAQGWFKAWDLSPNGRSSDIGYVENLIDWAGDNYNISESQIFTTGHSWGAYFSYYVAANLDDKIAAFGAHSGGFYSNPWLGGTPEVPNISEESPVLNGIILHAKDDEIVPYANSQTLYDNLLANGHNVYQDGVGKDGIIEVNGWGPQNHRWRLENNQEQWNFFTSVAPSAKPICPFKATDNNGDGLVDGLTNYHLFKDGEAIALTDKKGRTKSAATHRNWDITAAVQQDSGFQVLLDGASKKEGKYRVWSTNSEGVITGQSGWKSAAQAVQLGWEGKFNSDFNGDQILTAVNDQNLF